MTGLSDYTAGYQLNWITGQLATPALPSVWLALFTTAPADAGTGGTEVSGGSYARVQVAGTGTTNGTTANGNPTLHFATTPAWVVAGMSIRDVTSASVIPAGTTVLSFTGTTVTMSANATGAGGRAGRCGFPRGQSQRRRSWPRGNNIRRDFGGSSQGGDKGARSRGRLGCAVRQGSRLNKWRGQSVF